ncbi:MAG: riboflavin biosynthesis protein RibD [Rhizobacter sp.]|nr:riboflavin biosynthesis protein RibD [Rhizobacter sp.]
MTSLPAPIPVTSSAAASAPATSVVASRSRDAVDLVHLRSALVRAHEAIGLSDPNPRVGCVIVSRSGQVLGSGHTQQAGGPHAEPMALRAATEAHGAAALKGATAYVTLEPCSHHGRTPPCADALVAAGLGRVVIAVQDPNPLVAGQGIARLRAAGIEVDSGLLEDEARELNIGFFSRMTRGRPWVRLKAAVSLDGRTALENGASQWITGVEARTDGHAFRKRAGAVLTGVGTVVDDDPRMDVRLVPTEHQPLRVIVDSRMQVPTTARILAGPGAALVYAAAESAERRARLEATGAEVAIASNPQGKVDLAAMLDDLGRRGINELHVEAGYKLNGSMVREGLVDEFLIYIAPALLGSGLGLAAFGPLDRLEDAPRLRFHDVTRLGDDLRVLARPL